MKPRPPERLILKGSRWDVVAVPVATREGETVEREVIRHPGSTVIVGRRMEDDGIVMIWNRRQAVGRELLELPAGTLVAGEAPLECASREFREETGYEARDLRLIGSFYLAPSYSDELMHVFYTEDIGKAGAQELDPEEEIRVEIVRMTDIPGRIQSGEIADAKSLAALSLFRGYRRE